MIRIIEKGQPKAQIVVAETPMKVEEHAAAELQSYLFQMSGARVPIVCKPSKELSNLFVGSACPTQGLDLSSNTFGFDGYIVKTVGKDVLLVGVKPYSCLYAVYHLLEQYLDFGFFEDGDQIPHRDTVDVPEIDAIRKPRFELRGENLNMQPVYSGMRWWDWPEFKQWLDYLIKKHMNLMDADGCGIPALAAAKFGIQIGLNDYQKKRMDLLKRLYEYARMCGFRVMNSAGLYRQTSHGDVGFSAEAEGPQFTEFIAKLEAQTGEKLPGTPLEWCGYHSIVLAPSHPTVKRVITAGIEASIETYGTDHVYGMWLPSEEGIGGGDKEAGDKATYDSIIEVMKLIKNADPEAIIYTPPPCAGNPTFEAQKRAIRDSGLPIFGDVWLNNPGRMQDFLICDYYWGIPWTTGMLGQCGRATNPNGDLRYAIKNVQTLASDPRADKLFGFRVSNEINHRNIMTLDAFHTLAWNPGELDADEYIRKYNARRYGPDAAERLWPATEIITQTLLAYQDQGVMNGVLYRHWDGTNLPGTTSVSVKRAISFLPKLRTVMELLLAEHDTLKESPLYQFDVIDYGRTYLSAQFNDKLARTRKAFRAGKKAEFEDHAAEVIEVMRFIAKYCSAHEQFRLKIMDDWASKYGEITPGYSNALVNWITFTCLLSLENWEMLLDYCADDFAELVEGYYLPRVKLYLQKMRELLEAGIDISGRQVERGSNAEMKARISDWATPQDNLVWSPYGDTCEPELTVDDEKLAHELILAGSLSGKYDFYNGPLDTLVRELLDRFPVPDDIADIMAEPDQAQSIERKIPVGIPGDVHNGFLTPSVVEQVRIPNELGYLVDKQPVSREYNLARGETTCYNIRLHHSLIITRLQDEPASIGDYPIAVFEFEALGGKYELRYDPGSDVTLAKFFVDKVG